MDDFNIAVNNHPNMDGFVWNISFIFGFWLYLEEDTNILLSHSICPSLFAGVAWKSWVKLSTCIVICVAPCPKYDTQQAATWNWFQGTTTRAMHDYCHSSALPCEIPHLHCTCSLAYALAFMTLRVICSLACAVCDWNRTWHTSCDQQAWLKKICGPH